MSETTAKTTTKKTTTAAAKAAPKSAAKAPSRKSTGNVTPEQRYCMIAEAAYFRAESRGFEGGDPSQDWVEAEAQIDALLGKTH